MAPSRTAAGAVPRARPEPGAGSRGGAAAGPARGAARGAGWGGLLLSVSAVAAAAVATIVAAPPAGASLPAPVASAASVEHPAATRTSRPHLSDHVPRARGCIRLGPGWAGVKVLVVQRRLGTTSDRERYLADTRAAVEAFQSDHGLPVTGRVGRTTWAALGIGRAFCMDRFTVQPRVLLSAGPRQRIATMLGWALDQVGRRYVWSGAGALGYDCSGLALQAMHAAGLVLPGVTTFEHQHSDFPTASAIRDSGLRTVPFAERRRGDLVYWGGGPGGAVTHMALYLGHDRVVEAVRPRVRVGSVWAHAVPLKGYVVRPFPLTTQP